MEREWAVDLLHGRNNVQFSAEELAIRNERFAIARQLQVTHHVQIIDREQTKSMRKVGFSVLQFV